MEDDSTDKFLINELQRGHIGALADIYAKYRDYLLSVATHQINDGATPEDVVHETFVSFADHVSHLELRGTLQSYLTACVVHKIRDWGRRHATDKVHLGRAPTVGSDPRNPVQKAIDDEEFHRVQAALARLPFEQQRVVNLRMQGGMTAPEIAESLGIRVVTVRDRYKRALKALRQQLKATSLEQEDQ